ncbi:unnamed protein product [Durusdinium trenchii]|uniref:Uncharacterized protein n=1 Tax=Durusdinium trenchii TaxID=1381693 RepID=A0ABP0SIQ7_9DINO
MTDQLERGRALQVENQSLRNKLKRIGQPTDLQGAGQLSPRLAHVISARPSAEEVQQARTLLASRYQHATIACSSGASSDDIRLGELLRKRLELKKCQEKLKHLESSGESARLQLREAEEAIRVAQTTSLSLRRARQDVLDGGRATCGPLQLAKASLKQKQQQLKLLRLEAQSPELWPDAVKKLHRILQPFGEESLLRDVLLRWCHVALWSLRRLSNERRAQDGEQADTMEVRIGPVALLELVPQNFTTSTEEKLEVVLVARVDQQVQRTSSQQVQGKAAWLEHHFTFEALSWKSTLELEVLSVGDPDSLGCGSVDFLSLTPGKWHVLKERIWGSTSGWLELWAYLTVDRPASPAEDAVQADLVPKPTQRELQKKHSEELVRDEVPQGGPSRPAAKGMSQRELQRQELENLLEDLSDQQKKEAKMKSLETKIAEMQAELEAMRSAGTSARQKRDQKRLERHGNANVAGIEKFRSAGKRLAEPRATESVQDLAKTFGFRFEDLFKLGQEVIDEGTSEEYNIYGDSDTEEKLARRQEEAKTIIAQEKERMDGGVLGRMRRGGQTPGGARQRAAKRKEKKGEVKDTTPDPHAGTAEERPGRSTTPRRTPQTEPVSVLGNLKGLLAFAQDGDDAASLPVKSCLLCGDRSAPLGARTLVSQVKNTMSMEVMQRRPFPKGRKRPKRSLLRRKTVWKAWRSACDNEVSWRQRLVQPVREWPRRKRRNWVMLLLR